MRLDRLILSMVVFSILITSGLLMINSFNDAYTTVNIDTGNISSLNKSAELFDLSKGLEEDLKGGDTDEENTEDSLFKSGFKAVRAVVFTTTTSLFSIPLSVIEDISGFMGIPPAFSMAATTVFLIIVGFGMIYLVFRFIPR